MATLSWLGHLNEWSGHASTHVTWIGSPAMMWAMLEPKLRHTLRAGEKVLDILVMHLGGNDLTTLGRGPLLHDMRVTLIRLAAGLVPCNIIWSEITPRGEWRGARSHSAVEASRRRGNATMQKVARNSGFGYVRHDPLSTRIPGYFVQDGMHLSDLGNEVFARNIWWALNALGCGE